MPPKSVKKEVAPKLPSIDDLLNVIDKNKEIYVNNLKEFASIYSYPISDNAPYQHGQMAIKKATDILISLGAEVEQCFGSVQDEARNLPLILSKLDAGPNKSSILVYCQLDDSGKDPLFLSSAKYVRGKSVMDSASFLIWINLILAHKEALFPLPYCIKFILDPVSRSDVRQLIQVLSSKCESFLSDIDICFAFCCNQRLTNKTPNIVYGLRGVADFQIKITKQSPDLFVDDQCDVLLDMVYMLHSLSDNDGNILIENINDDKNEVNEDVLCWLNTLQFDSRRLSHWFSVNDNLTDEVEHLKLLWFNPCIKLKGIESSTKDNNKELISGFTVFTVPQQSPQFIRKCVFKYLINKWKERNSPNDIEFRMNYWSWPWRADQLDSKYNGLKEAIFGVYKEKPQAALSASYLPFASIYRKLLDKNVLLFTLGSIYDNHLTSEERLSTDDFMNAIKVLARFINWIDPATAPPIPPPVTKIPKKKK